MYGPFTLGQSSLQTREMPGISGVELGRIGDQDIDGASKVDQNQERLQTVIILGFKTVKPLAVRRLRKNWRTASLSWTKTAIVGPDPRRACASIETAISLLSLPDRPAEE